MDKRTIIALVLIMILFFISQQLLWKNKQPVTNAKKNQPSQTERKAVQKEIIDEKDTQKEITESSLEESTLDSIPEIETYKNLRIENENLKVSFSNKGAIINSIILKEYLQPDHKEKVDLIPKNESVMDLVLYSSKDSVDLSQMVFNYEYFDNKQGIRFYREKNGERVIQLSYFIQKPYHLDFTLQIDGFREVLGYDISFMSGITDTEEILKYKDRTYQVSSQINNDIEKFKLSKLKDEDQLLNGNIDWVVLRSKYFLMSLIPDKRINLRNLFATTRNNSPAFKTEVKNKYGSSNLKDHFSIYLGPDISENLKAYNVGLENIIRVWKPLRPISRFFLGILKFIHKFVANYGVVIIIFSVFIKLLLSPLTHKMHISTHKMKKIQPELKEVQRKYKSDPRKMNTEIREIYKREGVSPMGGCLPLLIQFPILISIYPIFRYNIALRQSSFIFWLDDLSAPDPYYILPVVMGIFMLLQQKLMQQSPKDLEKMDEKQRAQVQTQKILMYVMPAFLVYIFISLPSGLVLYWLVFNVINVIQQYYLKKKMKF